MDSYMERDGARIAYEIAGDGHFLGHAHGLMSSRAAERHFGVIDSRIPGRRMLRYDARGHGRSSGRPRASDYRFGDHARDLLALLDETGNSEPVDFMGASMGAATVLSAAVLAPGRFRRLVLMVPPTAWEARVEQAGQYREMAEVVERHGIEPLRRVMAIMDPPEMFAGQPRRDVPPDVDANLLPAVLRGAADSDLPDRDDIARLCHRVLILAWETDPVHPVSTALALESMLGGAQLRVATTVSDIGNWGDLIGEFLSRRLPACRRHNAKMRMRYPVMLRMSIGWGFVVRHRSR